MNPRFSIKQVSEFILQPDLLVDAQIDSFKCLYIDQGFI